MKKTLALLLAACMTLSFAACNNDKKDTEETTQATTEATTVATEATTETETAITPVNVKVAALKGPTAMGMVKLMKDSEDAKDAETTYNFEISGAVDELTPKIIKGDVDIAAVPGNLASVLYNKTEGNVEVIAINTLGVIYIVENGDTIKSVEDLKGKTIYASGKGATPEYGLNYVLLQNGIDPEKDVNIEWKSEHTECAAALATEENAVAMLPQPFVTSVMMQNENVRVALDLTKEWDKTQENAENKSTMITGVVVARKGFVEEHPEALNDFLTQYKASVDYVNSNIEEAAKLIGSYDIIAEAVALKAIDQCNIVCITGDEMKTKYSEYLNVLFDQNPASVGGTLPDDNFYYTK